MKIGVMKPPKIEWRILDESDHTYYMTCNKCGQTGDIAYSWEASDKPFDWINNKGSWIQTEEYTCRTCLDKFMEQFINNNCSNVNSDICDTCILTNCRSNRTPKVMQLKANRLRDKLLIFEYYLNQKGEV